MTENPQTPDLTITPFLDTFVLSTDIIERRNIFDVT
jgi:hypothetical protein